MGLKLNTPLFLVCEFYPVKAQGPTESIYKNSLTPRGVKSSMRARVRL